MRAIIVLVSVLALVGCKDEAPGDERPDAAVPVCGDGVAEGDEACDGDDLRGQTCASMGAGGSGVLVCTTSCELDTEDCEASDCGDGFCNPADGESHLSCYADCRFTALATGERHSCGVRGDDSVWCWGKNHGGQLGSEPGVHSAVPVQVVGVPPASAIALGAAHGCALTFGGAVWCWGSNLYGQMGSGYGDTGPLPPTPVSGLSDVLSLAAGASHSCAVTLTGEIYCWGDNAYGQLGNDAPANVWIPARVQGVDDAATVTIGGEHDCPFTCATTTSHQALCWGCNLNGALGRGWPLDPQWDNQPAPLAQGSPGCNALTVIWAGTGHACGLTVDDGLCCWGQNDAHQMGQDLPEDLQPTPLRLEYPVGQPATWMSAGLGGRHSCGVLTSGSLLCWGANAFGQLGTDEALDFPTPRLLPDFDWAQTMDGGVEHSCVLKGDGTAWCFGQNFFGQLGDSTYLNRALPGPVAY